MKRLTYPLLLASALLAGWAVFISIRPSFAQNPTTDTVPLAPQGILPECPVSGVISSDQIWDNTCDWIITASVTVQSGVRLIIQEGVTVKFDPLTSLIIEGQLVATGTVTSPITFTSNMTTPAKGDWGYILFDNSSIDNPACDNSGSILQNTIIEYGGGDNVSDNGAIRIRFASPCINNNIIRNNAADGIHVWGRVNPVITNNTISNNGIAGVTEAVGIYFRVTALSAPINISNNTITGNTSSGIYIDVNDFTDPAPISISGNFISENMAESVSGGGIHFDAAVGNIFANIIISNTSTLDGGGLFLIQPSSSDNVVNNNVFANNTAGNRGGAIFLCDGCQPIINNNDFCGNSDAFDNDLFNNNVAGQPAVNAERNFWSELNSANVENHVWHSVDDPSLGFVDFLPFDSIPNNSNYCPEVPTPTPTPSPTPTSSPTPTPTSTPTPTPTPTTTPTPTNTPTPTSTASPTITPTPTNTNTPPPPQPQKVYFPLISLLNATYFEGPFEEEPNDNYEQANGPLRSGTSYFGLPTDLRDYFSIELENDGQIVIDVLDHPLESVLGTQIQLFYETVANGPVAVALSPPYHIEYNGQAGTYYIYIFNDTSKCGACNNPYTLIVTYP